MREIRVTCLIVSCMFLQKNHCADTNLSQTHNNITSNSSSLNSSFNNSNNSSLFISDRNRNSLSSFFISDSNRNSLKYENIKEEIADLQKDFATVKSILVETIDKEKETVIELRELGELRRELNQLRREIARNKEKDGTENMKVEENWIRESIVELRRELTEVESKVEEQGSCSPDPSLLLRIGQIEKEMMKGMKREGKKVLKEKERALTKKTVKEFMQYTDSSIQNLEQDLENMKKTLMGIPSVGRVGEERRIKEIQDKVSGLDESMEKIINAQGWYEKRINLLSSEVWSKLNLVELNIKTLLIKSTNLET